MLFECPACQTLGSVHQKECEQCFKSFRKIERKRNMALTINRVMVVVVVGTDQAKAPGRETSGKCGVGYTGVSLQGPLSMS